MGKNGHCLILFYLSYWISKLWNIFLLLKCSLLSILINLRLLLIKVSIVYLLVSFPLVTFASSLLIVWRIELMLGCWPQKHHLIRILHLYLMTMRMFPFWVGSCRLLLCVGLLVLRYKIKILISNPVIVTYLLLLLLKHSLAREYILWRTKDWLSEWVRINEGILYIGVDEGLVDEGLVGLIDHDVFLLFVWH